MFKKKFNNKKGILFWVTGLSGSGKTSISKKIKKEICKKFGPTIIVSGDDLRKIFGFNKYDPQSRKSLSKKFCKFAKFITDQKINLIFAIVGLINEPRKWNKKNISNYVEIYIKANLKQIIKLGKKKIYNNKKSEKIVGVNIQPEFPKNPDITINNNFSKSTDQLSKELLKKIKELYY
jgi:adenylylsulfate kinase-like enzyme